MFSSFTFQDSNKGGLRHILIRFSISKLQGLGLSFIYTIEQVAPRDALPHY